MASFAFALCIWSAAKSEIKTERRDFYLTMDDVGSAQMHFAIIALLICDGCAGIGF